MGGVSAAGGIRGGALELGWGHSCIRRDDHVLARENGFIVFTHDLDFSALLAATHETGPSVVQIRTQHLMPDSIGRDVVRVLRLRAEDLERGAVVSIDKLASRVRVLPIRRGATDETD